MNTDSAWEQLATFLTKRRQSLGLRILLGLLAAVMWMGIVWTLLYMFVLAFQSEIVVTPEDAEPPTIYFVVPMN